MSTSGTFSFSPNFGELVLLAFSRIQIYPPAISQMQLNAAQLEANLWLAKRSNMGPNLWTVDLQSVSLVQGTATYNVPAETVTVLDLYLNTNDSLGNATSTTLSALTRSDYANIATKDQQGTPTCFWFDRLIAPTLTMWPVPDGNGPYTLKYYRYRQVQDANLTNGQNVELPYLFLDAFVAGLAHSLARDYAPALEAQRKADADEAWMIASTQNTEDAPMSVVPNLAGYFL